MENVQALGNVNVEAVTQGNKVEANPEIFQALLGMLTGEAGEETPEAQLMPSMEASDSISEILGELVTGEEALEDFTLTNEMVNLIQSLLMPGMEVNMEVETEPNMSLQGDLMGSQLKENNTEATIEKPSGAVEMPTKTVDKASGTMEMPVKGEDNGVGTKKALLNNENTSMVDRLKEIETASKTTEGPPQKEFAAELSRLQVTKAQRNQSPEAMDRLKSDGLEVFSEIRMDKDNQLHIQKLPQGQDVKIQQNIEKIEASMVKMIQSVKEGDTSKMTVTLEPEALGKVNLDLKMENGRMTARIFVENNQVREMFDGKLHELTTNLQKHNINVDKIQLQVASGTESQQLDMGQQGSFSRHQGRQGWQSNQNYLFRRIEESLAGSHREKTQEGLSILA